MGLGPAAHDTRWAGAFLPECLKQASRRRKRIRAEVEVPLPQIAAELFQCLGLFGGFDAFGDHFHVQPTRNVDYAAHDDFAGTIAAQPINKGFVDLDNIDWKAQQMGERRKARAEIIKGDKQPTLA
jgi:hypothetical protein